MPLDAQGLPLRAYRPLQDLVMVELIRKGALFAATVLPEAPAERDCLRWPGADWVAIPFWCGGSEVVAGPRGPVDGGGQ